MRTPPLHASLWPVPGAGAGAAWNSGFGFLRLNELPD